MQDDVCGYSAAAGKQVGKDSAMQAGTCRSALTRWQLQLLAVTCHVV